MKSNNTEVFKTIMNPSTGKMVQSGGQLGKKIIKDYKAETIYNPLTGKQVKTGGSVGQHVLREYVRGVDVSEVNFLKVTDNTYNIMEKNKALGTIEVTSVPSTSRPLGSAHSNSKFEYTLRDNENKTLFKSYFENKEEDNLNVLYRKYIVKKQANANANAKAKAKAHANANAQPSDIEKFYLDVYIYFKYFVKLKKYKLFEKDSDIVTPSMCKEEAYKFKFNKCKVGYFNPNPKEKRKWNPILVNGLNTIIKEHKTILEKHKEFLEKHKEFLKKHETGNFDYTFWNSIITAYEEGNKLIDKYKHQYIDEYEYPNIEYTINNDKKTVSLRFYKITIKYDKSKNEYHNQDSIPGFVKTEFIKDKGSYKVYLDFKHENERYIVIRSLGKTDKCNDETPCLITAANLIKLKKEVKTKFTQVEL
jgi:hypothetical protein